MADDSKTDSKTHKADDSPKAAGTGATSQDAILARLEALEADNRRLRAATGTTGTAVNGPTPDDPDKPAGDPVKVVAAWLNDRENGTKKAAAVKHLERTGTLAVYPGREGPGAVGYMVDVKPFAYPISAGQAMGTAMSPAPQKDGDIVVVEVPRAGAGVPHPVPSFNPGGNQPAPQTGGETTGRRARTAAEA